MPRISVIIPHFGDIAPLETCLAALGACKDRQHAEALVVINGPAPASPPLQRRFPDIRFLHEPAPGAAHARNTGAAHARADLLLFIDSDCVPDPQVITAAVAAARLHDIAGGAVHTALPASGPLTCAQAFEAVFAFDQAAYIHNKGFSVTACLVTHRHVFAQVGGFRPQVSEDLDWCHRATALGFGLTYAPAMAVHHPSRKTWAELRSKWRRLTAQTYALGATSRARWAGRACLMPLSILAHIPRILASRKLPSPRDKAAAILMLTRLRLWRMGEMLRLSLAPRT